MAELVEQLLRQNPWWSSGRVEAVSGMTRRALFDVLMGQLGRKQMIAVVGMRRVGKTVLLLQLLERIIAKGDARRVLFFSFDELLAREPDIIERVLAEYERILKGELRDVVVMFDEINHIPDWQVVLKRFYDLQRGIKFIVSGSSAMQIRRGRESLAGRIYEFELRPLDFSEYLALRSVAVTDEKVQSPLLRKEAQRYLTQGGFPELVPEDDFESAKRYVRSITDKVLFADLPLACDIGNPDILRAVFALIAGNPGAIVEYKNLADALKVSAQTISKYADALEQGFLVRPLINRRGSKLASARKAKKYYLTTPSLALAAAMTEAEHAALLPALAENAVITHIDARHFWREYDELDALDGDLPVEVKYRDTFDIGNNLRAVKKLGHGRLTVVTRDTARKETREGIQVEYVPLWSYLLHHRAGWKESGER
jgi:predicted AAA+ superfamily ATPase